MKYRYKLLILLVLITTVPLLVLRNFGVRHLRLAEAEIIARLRHCRRVSAEKDLQSRLIGYSTGLRQQLMQAEAVVKIQAMEVERSLTKPGTFLSDLSKLPRHFSQDAKDIAENSTQRQAFKIIGPSRYRSKNVIADINRLDKMTPVYQKLNDPFFLRQQTLLENGLFSIYPAGSPPGQSGDPRDQEWYQHAIKGEVRPIIESTKDSWTGRMVFIVSLPVKRPGGQTAGATAVVLPVKRLLKNNDVLQVFQPDFPETRVFLAGFTRNPKMEDAGLEIIAEYGPAAESIKDGQAGEHPNRLASGDKGQIRAMQAGLGTHAVYVHKMRFEGKDSLWVAAPVFSPYVLVSITPYETILRSTANTENFVSQLIGSQTRFSLNLLLAMILIAVALAVLFSRTVTKPLKLLMQGIRDVSVGRPDVRVDIRSRDEFSELAKAFNRMAPLVSEHLQVEHSMAVAAEVQQHLLPKSDPRAEGLDISGTSIYCERIGGDYYDYLTLIESRPGRFGVAVGDVSDHGIPSALLMATARTLLRERVVFRGCMDCDIADINHKLFQDIGDSGRFMTLFYCEFDTKEKTVSWVRAGHDPAIVYDPNTGDFNELAGRGMALGVFGDTQYQEYLKEIAIGQIYAIGTDGIWESCNADGEPFGKDRLRKLIREHAGESAVNIRDAVLQAVKDFRGAVAQEDDMTLVIVKVEQ